jgi:hypothetical protein
MTIPQRLLGLTAALSWLSCDGCLGLHTSPVDRLGSTLPQSCQSPAPVIAPQRLDILFVIDNSSSMSEEQEAVAQELTQFIEAIRAAGGVRQDFQVGVITTSVYLYGRKGNLSWYHPPTSSAGRLRPIPDVLPDGGYLLETDHERLLSGEDPNLVDKFSRLVHQGTSGSGQETPFEAVRLALLGGPSTIPLADGGNQGFLRDGARLLVVVLTDEDDCSEVVQSGPDWRPTVTVSDDLLVADCTVQANSLYPVSEYHRLFTTQLPSRDGSPRDLVWAAIAPVSRSTPHAAQQVTQDGHVRNIDCPTSNQAGYRHLAMAQLFDPSLANLDSICRESFRETLIHIASLASVSQILEVTDVFDGRLMRVAITRADGGVDTCTLLNEGLLSFTSGLDGGTAKVQFGHQCLRRADDTAISVQLLCAN